MGDLMAGPRIDPTIWGNLTLTTMVVSGSNVSGPLNAVTMGGNGTADETAQDEDAFGAPGIVFRPRPPSKIDGSDGQKYEVGAETIAAHMGDRVTPLTWRDLRFNQVFPAPKPGTVALVGYGGGFLSFDDTAAKESLTTLYVPYANGSKAHAIILDPEQESIGIIHGDGLAIVLDPDNGITMRADGSTFANLGPGKFTVVANSINLRGNVALGANTLAAVPLLAGPASPPSPSVFVSPV